jgi:protein phosphatase
MNYATPYDPVSVPSRPASRERATTRREAARLMPWVRLEMAAASVRGVRRATNEDWHSALNGSAPLFVVADGVGGGAMAARASRELVRHLHHKLDGRRIDAEAIREALLCADREVGRSIATHTKASGAATVALCAGTGPLLSRWLVAWVGDCRVYRIPRHEEPARLLTVDDTYRHLSEAPPAGGSRDDPARMVGNGAVLAPNIERVAIGRGEMLAICSDGVHKYVAPGELSRVLHGSAPLVRRCEELLALARAHGSRDDATVLVVNREPRRARLVGLAAGGIVVAAIVATLLLML